MAAPKDRSAVEGDGLRHEWTRVLWFVALVASVLGVLALGASLSTDPPSSVGVGPVEPQSEPRLRSLPAGRASADPRQELPAQAEPPLDSAPAGLFGQPPAAPEPQDPVPPDPLADRIASDLERLAPHAGWTAQIAVLCDRVRVEALIESFGPVEPLHVLPAFQGQRPCFRLCWSRYESRQQAQAALDLPTELRAIAPNPVPKEIAEVVQ